MPYDSTLTVDEAFDRYEAIRTRLPAMSDLRQTSQMRMCSGLLDIADTFDAFVLDSFGVLNVGERAIAGAVECIQALRDRGKRLVVLTNAASYTRAAAVARYRSMGFDFAAEEVVSSRDVCVRRLGEMGTGLKWGAIAAADDGFEDIEAKVTHWDHRKADDVDGILLLSSVGINTSLLDKLEAALAARPRPIAVANPDLVAPRETGLSKEPGYFAHHLADKLGLAPEFYGKPFGNAFQDALASLRDLNPGRIAMVGDTLHTDILGGQAAGLKTVLVSDHGLFSGQDVQGYVNRSGIIPDYACAQI